MIKIMNFFLNIINRLKIGKLTKNSLEILLIHEKIAFRLIYQIRGTNLGFFGI